MSRYICVPIQQVPAICLWPMCYETDFATTALAFFFFCFGVELQHSAVAGSQPLCQNWRLCMCSLRYDWSAMRVAMLAKSS